MSASKAGAISSARRISSVDDFEAERAGRCLNLAHLQHGAGIANIGHDRQPAKTGNNLAQKFEALAGRSVCWIDRPVTLPPGRARLATRPVPTGSPASAKTIGMTDVACFAARTAGARRDNDIDLQPDELGRDLGEALAASLRPAILDRDGATLDPAEFAQPLHKSGGPWAPGRRRGRAQEPDGRQLRRLLRTRRERPRCRRAAEQRDELAPLSLDHLVGAGEQRSAER